MKYIGMPKRLPKMSFHNIIIKAKHHTDAF